MRIFTAHIYTSTGHKEGVILNVELDTHGAIATKDEAIVSLICNLRRNQRELWNKAILQLSEQDSSFPKLPKQPRPVASCEHR